MVRKKVFFLKKAKFDVKVQISSQTAQLSKKLAGAIFSLQPHFLISSDEQSILMYQSML